jgi:nucleoid DNA-binding protein
MTTSTPKSPVAAPKVPTLRTTSSTKETVAKMRKKELIDLVVERSGIKKKDAKPTIEAVLAILGEAIASGRELNLQPFGKLRINRSEEKSNGRVIVCKLRQPLKTQPETPDTTVAE